MKINRFCNLLHILQSLEWRKWKKAQQWGRLVKSHHAGEGEGKVEIKFVIRDENDWWRYNNFLSKEKETVEWIGKMEKGKTLWDFGAHIGQYAVLAAVRGLEAVCFELDWINLSRIWENAVENGVEDRMVLLPMAVGGRKGWRVEERIVEDCRIGIRNGEGNRETKKRVRKVLGCHLTDFGVGVDGLALPDPKPGPAYLKIDVEGGEVEVLRGSGVEEGGIKPVEIMVEVSEETSGEVERILGKVHGETDYHRVKHGYGNYHYEKVGAWPIKGHGEENQLWRRVDG